MLRCYVALQPWPLVVTGTIQRPLKGLIVGETEGGRQ